MFLPWLFRAPYDLGIEPSTHEYFDKRYLDFVINDQCDRLRKLIQSIKKFGYDPERFVDVDPYDEKVRDSGINGYFLENEGKRKLYIVRGHHRAAVLAAMDQEIPFNFETEKTLKNRHRDWLDIGYEPFPNEFSGSDIENWPSVKSGYLHQIEAQLILGKYMKV